MRAGVECPERSELYVARPDNLVLIENRPDQVVIRAARDNFSDSRKSAFVHYLAAEGYIPERFEWFSIPDEAAASGLSWTIDDSWLANGAGCQRKATRQILRVVLGVGVAWLALVTLAVLHSPH